MDNMYWLKQGEDEALFPDLLWERPENKSRAGKLAIIGGNSFGFASVAASYRYALEAGAGTARVLLPDAIQKVVGPVIAEGEFAASNPSGSFSQKALGDVLDLSAWSDGVLIAGDLGRNSETAILLEKFSQQYSGIKLFTKDGVDYYTGFARSIADTSATCLVITLAQLQRLAIALKYTKPFTFSLSLIQLVDLLHEFTTLHAFAVIVKYNAQLVVAFQGQVSTTAIPEDIELWRTKMASFSSVWCIQNPSKIFEALTVAAHQVKSVL